MQTVDYLQSEAVAPRLGAHDPGMARGKTPGEAYEGIAFTFCKAATIILLTGKFALPVTAGAAAIFYVLAHCKGKTDTRCILQKPLLIATFWGGICLTSLFLHFRPLLMHGK